MKALVYRGNNDFAIEDRKKAGGFQRSLEKFKELKLYGSNVFHFMNRHNVGGTC
jgi:hypothetical protein